MKNILNRLTTFTECLCILLGMDVERLRLECAFLSHTMTTVDMRAFENSADDGVAMIARILWDDCIGKTPRDGRRVLGTGLDTRTRTHVQQLVLAEESVFDTAYTVASSVTCAEALQRMWEIAVDRDTNVLVQMVACCKMLTMPLMGTPDAVVPAIVWAGRTLLARYPMEMLGQRILEELCYVEWDDDTTSTTLVTLVRYMTRWHGWFRRGQVWDRQAHVLRRDERNTLYARVAKRVDVLFSTLLMAFGRLEERGEIAVAHTLMLEDMLEMVLVPVLWG